MSVAKEVISKLIDCDDFHCKCPCMLSSNEITHLLDYIYYLEEKNADLKELCNKYEEEHNTVFEEWKKVVNNEEDK